MASKLLLHNVLPMMIESHGKPTGRYEVNRGVLNLKLTKSGKNILLSGAVLRHILFLISFLSKILNYTVLMLNGF